jgi:branched-chain amino acid aminotransferase
MDAKSKGFADVLYLDSVHKRYVEEASSCNLFVLKGDIVATPATAGTILPGITRRSIIELARDCGYQVKLTTCSAVSCNRYLKLTQL